MKKFSSNIGIKVTNKVDDSQIKDDKIRYFVVL